MAMSERGRKRLLESIQRNSAEEIAELDSPQPWNEQQPLIDHLERHVYDEPFDADDDPDDTFDGRMNLDLEDDD